jgi:hypothetical protein
MALYNSRLRAPTMERNAAMRHEKPAAQIVQQGNSYCVREHFS